MKKILVVDDETAALLRMKKILGSEYAISLLKNGKDALDYIMDIGVPDLVIMDIEMPQMNGLDCVRSLREKKIQVPVLFMTGIEDEDIKNQCRIFGNSVYVVKPGMPADILEKVKSLLLAEE